MHGRESYSKSYSKSYRQDSHGRHESYDRHDRHDPHDCHDPRDHCELRARSHHEERERSRHEERERRSSHSRSTRDGRQTLEQRRLFFRGAPYHVPSYEVEREFRRFVGMGGRCDVGRSGGVQSLHGPRDAPVEGIRFRGVPQRA